MELTEREVTGALKQACEAAGSQKQWAAKHGFSLSFVNDVIHGRKNPTENLCEALGLKRLVVFRAK